MARPYVQEIEIPEKLLALVQREARVASPVNILVTQFSAWLSDNKTPLFFEYTDHGIAHVVNVLRSVESLIPDEVWPLMTPDDGVAIISAVLLHDCAMHLSMDGFYSLLDGADVVRRSAIYGEEDSWSNEYLRFEQEAVRWDARKLISVFGDSQPARPLDRSVGADDRQKMMIGEFLRRNHARLAHEIALEGVPGPGGVRSFSPFSSVEFERRDLYGFLARSHNMGIRESADLLQRPRRRRYLDVHCPYVMALLRVADYIQIDSARAPTQILQLRGLKSPISRSEWAKHHAVLELNRLGDDPEALNVLALPESVTIFSGLRALFRDLQKELDDSWALLGEVYGRVPELSSLGLTVRRLVSNLDDASRFERDDKPSYIPREMRLSTASAELLHLLVGPLYGNRPTIGARELLQNAVDATLEMNFQDKKSRKEPSFAPKVEVELDVSDAGDSHFRITDNGVGMSLETVERYFLTAGASFRRSAWWSASYSNEMGCSEVRRSGRFGVGALAVFLIGPVVTITTRHFMDESGNGLKFEISLDNDLVEVKRVRAEVGTSISVRITDPAVVDELLNNKSKDIPFWSWFLYADPLIKYRVRKAGEWSERSPEITIPNNPISEDSPWVGIEAPGFESVFWSYGPRVMRQMPYGHYYAPRYIACNGIKVLDCEFRSHAPSISISSKSSQFEIGHPNLAVNDRDGRFPLNVQRDSIMDQEYPFQAELVSSIAESYVRELHQALLIDPIPQNIPRAVRAASNAALSFDSSAKQLVALDKSGWIPLEEAVFGRNLKEWMVVELFDGGRLDGYITSPNMKLEADKILIPVISNSGGQAASVAFIRTLIDEPYYSIDNPAYRYRDHVSGLWVFMTEEIDASMTRKRGLPQYLIRQLECVLRLEGWVVYKIGDPASIGELEEKVRIASTAKARAFSYVSLSSQARTEDVTPFYEHWMQQVPGTYVNEISINADVEPEYAEANS
ncbi:TPA: ATP-binding protein [Stenotrophomonas maltophilia]